jgi:dynein heavy chain 1
VGERWVSFNSWIKANQVVTKVTRDVSPSTASQEVNF